MTRPHQCNQNPYAVCTCGRPGYGTFGPKTRPRTDLSIERTFEFVEATADGQTFAARDVQSAAGPAARWCIPTLGMVEKTLRLMEHLGYVQKVTPGGPWRPDVWRRATLTSTPPHGLPAVTPKAAP